MSSQPVTLSPEVAAQAVRLVDEARWREDCRVKGRAIEEDCGLYELLVPIRPDKFSGGPPFPHTDLCRCSPPPFRAPMVPGDVLVLRLGDLKPDGKRARRLTEEEARDAVPFEEALALQAVTRPLAAATGLIESVKNEISMLERERDAITEKIAGRGESLKIAEGRVESAKADVEKFFAAGRGNGWRVQVSALAAEINARSSAAACPCRSTDPGAFVMGKDGPTRLSVGREGRGSL